MVSDVDAFGVSQLYAIIILPNGGPDLEAYTWKNVRQNGWKQACSLFFQVAKSLGQAEELVSFEVNTANLCHSDGHVTSHLIAS